WTSDNPSFEGKYCQFSNVKFLPKPVQKPHPPIWVGGHSQAAIRRAARLGNGWHPVGAIPAVPLEPEELAQNVAVLHRYAEQAGRDPSDLDVSMKTPLYDSGPGPASPRRRFSGSSEQILQDVQTYADVGVTHLIFDIRGSNLDQALERLEWFAQEIMARA
ncbi:MAG TPA: LLM class flavin-dependent oxidoreductase, partial [Dehalococcoidia bacterium]|nr:LLM class flavin-dependent oxidoreductase [Dehalococcoidia bacterium]